MGIARKEKTRWSPKGKNTVNVKSSIWQRIISFAATICYGYPSIASKLWIWDEMTISGLTGARKLVSAASTLTQQRVSFQHSYYMCTNLFLTITREWGLYILQVYSWWWSLRGDKSPFTNKEGDHHSWTANVMLINWSLHSMDWQCRKDDNPHPPGKLGDKYDN